MENKKKEHNNDDARLRQQRRPLLDMNQVGREEWNAVELNAAKEGMIYDAML